MSETSAEKLERILTEVEEGLQQGLLPAHVIADEALYRREIERIFSRAWCFVGHESEIPSRGDYVHRRIGNDAFVLVRGEDDEIRLLFDSCRHRGTMVCRSEKGNASHFRCSYHGWTYKNTGEWTGAPLYRMAYGEDFDRSKWGLLSAPHLANRHGFIFASLDPAAPPFEEYLGPMKWYFDMMFGQLKDGWEVVGSPQRWVMDSNWKIGSENFSGDDYHTLFLHRSIGEMGLLGLEDDAAGMEALHIQTGNGHTMSHSYIPPEEDEDGVLERQPPIPIEFWNWPNGRELFTDENFGPEMLETARRTLGNVGNVFPNFAFLSFPLQQVLSTGPLATQIVRVFNPRGPAEVETINWILVPKALSEEEKVASYRAAQGTFGVSGIFDQDDTEPFTGTMSTSQSQFAKQTNMLLNYQMGMDGTGGQAERMPDDIHPGPGVKYYPALEEGVQRGFYRRWAQFLKAGGYPRDMSAEQQNGAPLDAVGQG